MEFIVMTKNLYVYKFDYKILKFANEITQIQITVKKVIAYLQQASLLVVPKFLNFWEP